jgi:hypothetical protein
MNKLILLWVMVAGLMTGCGGASSPSIPSQTPTGSLPMGELQSSSVVLASNNLFDADALINEVLFAESAPSDCTVIGAGQGATGSCLTPLNMTGYASSINLGSSESTGPARLFGSTSYDISLDRHGELEVSPFDLKEPITIRANTNLEDQPEGIAWTTVSVFTAVLDVQAEIKNQYWTVRFAFVSQQPADEEMFESCIDDEHYLERIRENSGLLADGETTGTYRKGDLMVCIKNTPDEACTDGDFSWLDTDTGLFAAVRPENPLQHAFAQEYEPSCEAGSPGYEISLGGYDLLASFDHPFELSATMEESCLRDFTYTDPLSQETTTGNTLEAEFDYDMVDAVFLEDIDSNDISSTSDEDLLRAFTLQQIWIRSTYDDPTAAIGNDASLSAEPTITVSQNNALECLDSSDVDSQYLTGDDCTPDEQIRTDCEYESCGTGFDDMSGTIWSVQDQGGCNEYCTVQSCDDYAGSKRIIYCAPQCAE